ncbi:abortive infection protein [Streptomonospora alba]|uniref:Abortive infection protein n=1 Tax=Streptomonospora alba TaxID=183763 RepID=A0A0C2J9F4_9ACTN|nr:type II CAAX endopeptidase family protein [Streptomonospora alba]KIH98116.1 abortive infection protein [Streptomonospora alba]
MSTARPEHSDRPHEPAAAGAAGPVRPGWPEVVVGLVALVAAVVVLPFFGPLGLELDDVTYGLVVAAWSGVAGLTGFAAAALVRIRSWGAFSVRRTTWRWMGIGVFGGLVALGANAALTYGITELTGFDANPQGMYYDAAGGGVLPMVLTFSFLSLLTPLGEEFLFRGVLANALLRYGPVVGVLGSSVVFALFHGINIVLPAALAVGVVAAELMRRSGSIWPAVAVHVVNNAALPLYVLLTGPGPA